MQNQASVIHSEQCAIQRRRLSNTFSNRFKRLCVKSIGKRAFTHFSLEQVELRTARLASHFAGGSSGTVRLSA